MLLGIALHGGMSFVPSPYNAAAPIHDRHTSMTIGMLMLMVHGFRMQVFFLISGFFTAMLWRKRGLRSLLVQRFNRIFLPLVFGMVTIIPITSAVCWYASSATNRNNTKQLANYVSDEPARRAADGYSGDHTSGMLNGRTSDASSFNLGHLWFLWFVCWLVVGFAVCVTVAQWIGLKRAPGWITISRWRYAWLLPPTMVAQYFMDTPGADPSIGLIPSPLVLSYYAIFFGFGALYFDADDRTNQVGRQWWILLPIAFFVAFPLGSSLPRLEGMQRALGALSAAAFAWLACFGLLGLSRRLFSGGNAIIRYLSDSSYWQYLAHIPLVLLMQHIVRDWSLSVWAKYLLVCLTSSGILLLTYQLFVRYTWIGTLLNGPRRPTHFSSGQIS